MKCKVRVYTRVRKWKQYIVEGDCVNHCRSIAVNMFKDEFPDYAYKLPLEIELLFIMFKVIKYQKRRTNNYGN